jgi:hypothetical protein
MVGNNTPVFFIRDPMKFQHFIHSQKRRADSGLRDGDMQWDFWTLSPESAHQVTILMSDRVVPRSYRHMNGYTSHTYIWINTQGERFWVKYHFKTDQGIDFLTQEEADRIAWIDADYHRRDLFNAIKNPVSSLRVFLVKHGAGSHYEFSFGAFYVSVRPGSEGGVIAFRTKKFDGIAMSTIVPSPPRRRRYRGRNGYQIKLRYRSRPRRRGGSRNGQRPVAEPFGNRGDKTAPECADDQNRDGGEKKR